MRWKIPRQKYRGPFYGLLALFEDPAQQTNIDTLPFFRNIDNRCRFVNQLDVFPRFHDLREDGAMRYLTDGNQEG